MENYRRKRDPRKKRSETVGCETASRDQSRRKIKHTTHIIANQPAQRAIRAKIIGYTTTEITKQKIS